MHVIDLFPLVRPQRGRSLPFLLLASAAGTTTSSRRTCASHCPSVCFRPSQVILSPILHPPVTQDYRIHHEEVCSKLVAIMRERLSANIKQLPALAATWPAGPVRAEAPSPSSFATTAAKQLQVWEGAQRPWRYMVQCGC